MSDAGSKTWWLPQTFVQWGLLDDGSLHPRIFPGRGLLMHLVADPRIDENGLAYLARPFAHRVLDV